MVTWPWTNKIILVVSVTVHGGNRSLYRKHKRSCVITVLQLQAKTISHAAKHQINAARVNVSEFGQRLSCWLYVLSSRTLNYMLLEMWANAQRDGRPAEYRWRPLFNAAKFGWRPILDCRAVTLLRCKTRLNLLGCPKLPDRSHSLVGRSSPYISGYVEEVLLFWVSRMQQVSDLHSKFALRPHHVRKYVRHPISDRWDQARKEKKKNKKIEITGQKYNGLPYSIGRP